MKFGFRVSAAGQVMMLGTAFPTRGGPVWLRAKLESCQYRDSNSGSERSPVFRGIEDILYLANLACTD